MYIVYNCYYPVLSVNTYFQLQRKHHSSGWMERGMCKKIIQHTSEGGWYQAVAVDSKGLLAVTDGTNKCIHLILKDEGALLRSIGTGVLGSNLFGVAFDLNGNVWVTDYTNSKVVKLSQQGQLLQAMHQTGSEGVHFHDPFGVSVNHGGLIYVCDCDSHHVTVLDEDSTFLFMFGSQGNDQEYPVLHYCH